MTTHFTYRNLRPFVFSYSLELVGSANSVMSSINACGVASNPINSIISRIDQILKFL